MTIMIDVTKRRRP